MNVEDVIETLGYALAQARTDITIGIIGALATNLGAKQDKYSLTEFVNKVRENAESRGWANPDSVEYDPHLTAYNPSTGRWNKLKRRING